MTCPHPRKRRYRSALDAKIALAGSSANPTRGGGNVEVRYYRCQCGGWHLTSQKPLSPNR